MSLGIREMRSDLHRLAAGQVSTFPAGHASRCVQMPAFQLKKVLGGKTNPKIDNLATCSDTQYMQGAFKKKKNNNNNNLRRNQIKIVHLSF
jgi:hypothetical protein